MTVSVIAHAKRTLRDAYRALLMSAATVALVGSTPISNIAPSLSPFVNRMVVD
jgi:hypothetical protein